MRAEFPWHRSYINSARPRCASAIEFVSHFRAARRCSTRVERKLFWMRMREPHHHLSDTILHPLTKIVWHIVTQRLFSQTTGRWHKQIETARYVYTHIYIYLHIPVVPHKAVAGKFQKYETYRKGWLLWLTDGRAYPLMERKVVGAVFSGVLAMVAVVTSPQLLDVVWCSAVVVVGVVVVVV